MPGAIISATFALEQSTEARNKQLDIVYYRKKTQPYGAKSAGCVFRNPECGYAGALIDKLGLKGTRIGGAQVSEVHANFIVNLEQASSNDVKALIKHIQQKVQDTEKVFLESEIRILSYQGKHNE
jgi:UDP-N-acetylmuramate dehydrogenase